MRQVMDGSGNPGIVILSDEVSACGIAGGSNNAPLAWRPTPHPSAWVRAAPLCIIATLLASTWASQTLASGEARQAQARPGGDRSVQLAQTTSSDPKEPPPALEQEHQRAEMLVRELAAVRRDLEILQTRLKEAGEESARARQAADSEIAKLRKSLQQERDGTGRAMSAAESSAAELRKTMMRERAERLERDIARMRGDADARTAPAATAKDEASQPRQAADMAELQKSLQKERERAVRLEQDLAAARREAETQTALAAKANDEATRLKQTADSDAGKLKKERERGQRLQEDLGVARREVETQTALAAKARTEATELKQGRESGAAELQKSLQKERERAVRLEQDLAAARREAETQTALAAKAGDEATRLKHVAEQGAAELRTSLQQERGRVARLERDLALARSTKQMPVVGQTAQAQQVKTDVAEPVAPAKVAVANLRGDSPGNSEDAPEMARLVARASVLLGQGDIGSARTVLERAAETGSAQASFMLAETYDPL
ncbi:MAG TPA: hypothetical protein VN065_08170, partial [Bradyrhizobium sp.]|nr:hypothetical protein [Bradyrhizobium sp.]